MCGIYLTDTYRENVKVLIEFLAQLFAVDPEVLQNSRGHLTLIEESESAIPGLELTWGSN